MTTTATIFVRFQAVGFHRWPEAPPKRDYLAVRHRHNFHIEVRTDVSHDGREIEFHDLQDVARTLWENAVVLKGEAGAQSCERLARRLAVEIQAWYRSEVIEPLTERMRRFTVSVSEDGECGAEVTVTGD